MKREAGLVGPSAELCVATTGAFFIRSKVLQAHTSYTQNTFSRLRPPFEDSYTKSSNSLAGKTDKVTEGSEKEMGVLTTGRWPPCILFLQEVNKSYYSVRPTAVLLETGLVQLPQKKKKLERFYGF